MVLNDISWCFKRFRLAKETQTDFEFQSFDGNMCAHNFIYITHNTLYISQSVKIKILGLFYVQYYVFLINFFSIYQFLPSSLDDFLLPPESIYLQDIYVIGTQEGTPFRYEKRIHFSFTGKCFLVNFMKSNYYLFFYYYYYY